MTEKTEQTEIVMYCDYCTKKPATLQIETKDLITGNTDKISVCDDCVPDVTVQRQGHQSLFDRNSHQRASNW